jgi:protein SCO1
MNAGNWIRRILLFGTHYSLLALLFAVPASAHDDGRPLALKAVALDQRLGGQVPLNVELRDERGKSVRLGDYFGARPVILTFAYYRCQDLCPLVLDGLLRTLRALSFSAGDQFNIVNVSFDPRDTPALAAAKKGDLIKRYARPGAAEGWHFLTGDEATIQRLTAAAGFRYNYEKDQDRFGHAAGILLLTPDGRLARYFYGIEFSPRDLRLGLIEASNGKIGSPIDQLLLFCYHYDPAAGKYGLLVTNLVRGASVATILALAIYIALSLRTEAGRRAKWPKSA